MSALQFLVVILLLCWLTGYGFHLGGELIHLVLVIAVVIFVIDALRGRSVL